MNWKDVPNLFANGRFKVKYIESNFLYFEYIELYTGIEFNDTITTDKTCGVPIQDCTLVARKIEDMTDEEIETLYDKAPIGTPSGELPTDDEIKEYSSDVRDGFLYLLSIGVYPFDQKHFETGEVIDINSEL